MRFFLPIEVEAQLCERARRALPAEACGLILGTRRVGVFRIECHYESANLADSPLDSYRIDPVAHLAAEREARAAGLSVLGSWHSHPRGPATPSIRDRRGAPANWLLLIVAAHEGLPERVRVHHEKGAETYRELERVHESPSGPGSAIPL